MTEQMNTTQVTSWIQSASPDDLITVSKSLFSRIGSLDQPTQQRYTREVGNNPQVSKLFTTQPQHDQVS
jgi:hypothetical protein